MSCTGERLWRTSSCAYRPKSNSRRGQLLLPEGPLRRVSIDCDCTGSRNVVNPTGRIRNPPVIPLAGSHPTDDIVMPAIVRECTFVVEVPDGHACVRVGKDRPVRSQAARKNPIVVD